jgi:hypothetical protein
MDTPRNFLKQTMRTVASSHQQEMHMKTRNVENVNSQDVEINLLSDDELDAVAGGAIEDSVIYPFLVGFFKTAPEAGRLSVMRASIGC